MANNLRVFQTTQEYNNADLVLPSVSYIVSENGVHYDVSSPEPPTPPSFDGKVRLTYSNGQVYEIAANGNTTLTEAEITGGPQAKSNIVSAEIGTAVTNIGDGKYGRAFYQCSSLTSVTIPSSVTFIGFWGFYYCQSLRNVTINSLTPPTLQYYMGSYMTFNNTGNCPIYVPSQAVNEFKSASGWRDKYAGRVQAIPT